MEGFALGRLDEVLDPEINLLGFRDEYASVFEEMSESLRAIAATDIGLAAVITMLERRPHLLRDEDILDVINTRVSDPIDNSLKTELADAVNKIWSASRNLREFNFDSLAIQSELVLWLAGVGSMMGGSGWIRSIAVEDSWVGWTDADCAPGDVVYLCYGVTAPMILRPTGQQYRLVGICRQLNGIPPTLWPMDTQRQYDGLETKSLC